MFPAKIFEQNPETIETSANKAQNVCLVPDCLSKLKIGILYKKLFWEMDLTLWNRLITNPLNLPYETLSMLSQIINIKILVFL